MNLLQAILLLSLRAYRSVISPVFVAIFSPMGLGCRFTPTCSEYALDAVRTHGATRGTALAVGRLCRCHPWGGCGHDPVPTKQYNRPTGSVSASEMKRPFSNLAMQPRNTLNTRKGNRSISLIHQVAAGPLFGEGLAEEFASSFLRYFVWFVSFVVCLSE